MVPTKVGGVRPCCKDMDGHGEAVGLLLPLSVSYCLLLAGCSLAVACYGWLEAAVASKELAGGGRGWRWSSGDDIAALQLSYDSGTKAGLSKNSDNIGEREEKGRAFGALVSHRHGGR